MEQQFSQNKKNDNQINKYSHQDDKKSNNDGIVHSKVLKQNQQKLQEENIQKDESNKQYQNENEKQEQLLQQNDHGQQKQTENLQISIRNTWVRWPVLFMLCLLMMGMQASQDSPSIIQDHIYDDMFNYINARDQNNIHFKTEVNVKYSWIFSIGNITSAIFPFLIGILIVRFGERKLLIIFVSCVTLGQFICAFSGLIGGEWNSSTTYAFFLIGRLLLYLGGDSVAVAVKSVVGIWFYGQEMAFAVGSPSSFNKLGTTISGWILESLYQEKQDLLLPFLVLAVYLSFTLIVSLVLIFIDLQREKQLQSGALGESKIKKVSSSFKFKDFKKMSLLFWIVVANFSLNIAAYQTWSNYANQLLKNQYSVPSKDVGRIITFPSLASAIGIPIAGFLLDQFGKQQYFLLFASFCSFLGQLLFCTLPQCPISEQGSGLDCNTLNYWVPTVLFGIYKIFSIPAAYSLVSMTLDKDLFGLGMGIVISGYNISQFLAMQAEALIIGGTSSQLRGGYLYQQIFNTILSAVATALTLILIYLNIKRGGVVGLSKKQLQEMLLNKMQQERRLSSVQLIEQYYDNNDDSSPSINHNLISKTYSINEENTIIDQYKINQNINSDDISEEDGIENDKEEIEKDLMKLKIASTIY